MRHVPLLQLSLRAGLKQTQQFVTRLSLAVAHNNTIPYCGTWSLVYMHSVLMF